MSKIGSIYVEVKGDSTQFQKDIRQLKSDAKKSGEEIANALNNSVSARQASSSISNLSKNLIELSASAKVPKKNFEETAKSISTGFSDVSKKIGMTSSEFAKLNERILRNQAFLNTERSLKQIANAAKLSEREIKNLAIQMGYTSSEANKFASNISKASKDAEKSFNTISASLKSMSSVLAGISIASFAKEVSRVGIAFEQTMAEIKGVSRATEDDFKSLTAAAREMGEKTEWSASQSASALKFMSMAGFSAQDSIKALPGMLDLATAGQLELGRASDIVTDSLTAMGMSVDQLGRFNDVLIATTTRANTNIEQMGEALKYVAPIASQLGYNIEDVSTMLGTLANSGIKASQAGTSLSQMLLRNMEVAKEFGTAGNDLIGTLKAVKDANWDATEIAKAYGVESTKSVLSIMSQIEQYENLRSTLNDVEGEAKKLANVFRDTVGNSFKSLGSAIESLMLDVFDKYKDDLKSIIESTTVFVRDNKDVVVNGIDDILDTMKTIIGSVNDLLPSLGSITDIFKEYPAVLQVGLIGLVLGGPKLAAAIAGITFAIEKTKEYAEALALLKTGDFELKDLSPFGLQDRLDEYKSKSPIEIHRDRLIKDIDIIELKIEELRKKYKKDTGDFDIASKISKSLTELSKKQEELKQINVQADVQKLNREFDNVVTTLSEDAIATMPEPFKKTAEETKKAASEVKKLKEESKNYFDSATKFIKERDDAEQSLIKQRQESVFDDDFVKGMMSIGDDYKEAEKQAKKLSEATISGIKESQKEVSELEKIWNQTFQQMEKSGADMFYNLFKTGKMDFSNLFDSITDMWLQMLAQMASKDMMSMLTGGGSAQGGLIQTVGQLFSGGSGGGQQGGGGILGDVLQLGKGLFGGEGGMLSKIPGLSNIGSAIGGSTGILSTMGTLAAPIGIGMAGYSLMNKAGVDPGVSGAIAGAGTAALGLGALGASVAGGGMIAGVAPALMAAGPLGWAALGIGALAGGALGMGDKHQDWHVNLAKGGEFSPIEGINVNQMYSGMREGKKGNTELRDQTQELLQKEFDQVNLEYNQQMQAFASMLTKDSASDLMDGLSQAKFTMPGGGLKVREDKFEEDMDLIRTIAQSRMWESSLPAIEKSIYDITDSYKDTIPNLSEMFRSKIEGLKGMDDIKWTQEMLTPAEIEELQTLMKDAVGFSSLKGMMEEFSADSVSELMDNIEDSSVFESLNETLQEKILSLGDVDISKLNYEELKKHLGAIMDTVNQVQQIKMEYQAIGEQTSGIDANSFSQMFWNKMNSGVDDFSKMLNSQIASGTNQMLSNIISNVMYKEMVAPINQMIGQLIFSSGLTEIVESYVKGETSLEEVKNKFEITKTKLQELAPAIGRLTEVANELTGVLDDTDDKDNNKPAQIYSTNSNIYSTNTFVELTDSAVGELHMAIENGFKSAAVDAINKKSFEDFQSSIFKILYDQYLNKALSTDSEFVSLFQNAASIFAGSATKLEGGYTGGAGFRVPQGWQSFTGTEYLPGTILDPAAQAFEIQAMTNQFKDKFNMMADMAELFREVFGVTVDSTSKASKSMDKLADTIDKKIADLRQSDFNVALPKEKFEDALKRYTELYDKAMGGDAKAASEFVSFTDKFLESAQKEFKSSGQYKNIFEGTIKALEDVKGVSTEKSKTEEETEKETIEKQNQTLLDIYNNDVKHYAQIINAWESLANDYLEKIKNDLPVVGSNIETAINEQKKGIEHTIGEKIEWLNDRIRENFVDLGIINTKISNDLPVVGSNIETAINEQKKGIEHTIGLWGQDNRKMLTWLGERLTANFINLGVINTKISNDLPVVGSNIERAINNSKSGIEYTIGLWGQDNRKMLTWLGGLLGYKGEGYADGGIVSGPESGYSATLHGREAIIPLKKGYVPVQISSNQNNNDKLLNELKDIIKSNTIQSCNIYLDDGTKLSGYIRRESDAVRVEAERRQSGTKRIYN